MTVDSGTDMEKVYHNMVHGERLFEDPVDSGRAIIFEYLVTDWQGTSCLGSIDWWEPEPKFLGLIS